jgi:hypothetical protein
MRKNLIWGAMAFLLMFLVSCEKMDNIHLNDQQPVAVKNPDFSGLSGIAFSVENNTLVFDTEGEFQKCLDFIREFNDKDLDLFEKKIGFSSLRSGFKNNLKLMPIDDHLFASLLNPGYQVVVEGYMFVIDPAVRKIKAVHLGDGCDLKSLDLKTGAREFLFSDEVFAILKNEPVLKSTMVDYCGQENIHKTFADNIETSVDYNKYGIYNSLVAKIWRTSGGIADLRQKTVDYPFNPPQIPPKLKENTITSRCFFRREEYQNNIVYDTSVSSEELKVTPFLNTRRLVGFRYDVEFYWKTRPVYYYEHDNSMIECHRY